MQPQAREPHAESHPASERIAALETEVAALRQELELIKERFTQFQKQFE